VVDLAGVDVVDAEAGWISAASSQIESSAQEMLALSMLSLNQTQLATALQVFRNLHRLREIVAKLVAADLAGDTFHSGAWYDSPEVDPADG
jgi:hypothetical protein